MKSLISIDHFENSVFVCVLTTNRGIKPDVLFSRYTSGKEKPHYPVPARSYWCSPDKKDFPIQKLMDWSVDCVSYWSGGNDG